MEHFTAARIADEMPLATAIDRVGAAFAAYARGDWAMPPKVYVDGEGGDFRAMPARGGGHALLKWVTSFPDNPARGLPTVGGIVLLSDATDGRLVATFDAGAITSLRTAAAAAVATRLLARPDAASVGVVGAGVNGAQVARALAATVGGDVATRLVCDRDAGRAARAAGAAAGFAPAPLDATLACDIVCTVTPGAAAFVGPEDLRAGQHWNLMGADAPGKAEMTLAALSDPRVRLFCDDLAQAGHSGDIARLHPTRDQVVDLGQVAIGAAPGRGDAEQITVFDSTGLAVQDLALALALVGR